MRPHRGSQKAMWSLAVSDTTWLGEVLISTTHIKKPLCGIVNARRHSLQPTISICWPCSLLSASDAWAIEYILRHAACMLSYWHVYHVIRWCSKNEWNLSAHIFTLSCGSVCMAVHYVSRHAWSSQCWKYYLDAWSCAMSSHVVSCHGIIKPVHVVSDQCAEMGCGDMWWA